MALKIIGMHERKNGLEMVHIEDTVVEAVEEAGGSGAGGGRAHLNLSKHWE